MRPSTVIIPHPPSARAVVALAFAALALVGCAARGDEQPAEAGADVTLGPADGHDLPATDLDRVQAGDLAPDFTLTSLEGPPVTLSSLRGEKNVVLVFYRGHW